MRAELGWAPEHDLKAGLRRTVRWYLENPAWLQAIAARPGYREWLEKNTQNGKGW